MQISNLSKYSHLLIDPSKNLQEQLDMIGVEGDPNDTEMFPLANFNPVCQVDVVRTDYEGKAEEYKEPDVPEPVLEVVTALPEVEVIQKKDPPPIPPPPVTEARLTNYFSSDKFQLV